jgi:lysophospholipase L1-like esterase
MGAIMNWRRRDLWQRALAPLALATLVAAGATLVAAGPVSAAKAPATYYVSIGDSYAVGYQPDPGVSLRHGYTGVVVSLEHRKGTDLTLANFGCGGATTASLLSSIGCPDAARATHGEPYTTTSQAFAATEFITAHRGHIGLITISIGGNDITACALAASPTACVAAALPVVSKNVDTLVQAVHAAAGPKVPIVGLTYPDVILGSWVRPPANQTLAKESVLAFGLLINPALKKAYTSNGGSFIDVTKATGAYTALTKTVMLAPYGQVPVAVSDVCTLTWYCAKGDIHPHTSGYALIGKLIVNSLGRHLP